MSYHSFSTPEDVETLPRIFTISVTIPQTIQDDSLTLVKKGSMIDYLTARRILRVLGITTRRVTQRVSLVLTEPACCGTSHADPIVSFLGQTHR